MGEEARKSIASLIVKYVAIIIIITLGYQSVKLMKVSKTLDNKIKATEKEIAIEGERLKSLQEEYENINTLENIEKQARDSLGLVKEDEIVFKAKEN